MRVYLKVLEMQEFHHVCLQSYLTLLSMVSGKQGLINSASSFGFKVGNGLGSAILGWVIGAAGAGTGSEITFIWIPAILCIGQVVVMWFYKLDKEYDGIVEALEKEGAAK